jgi:peptide chain release factor subunit 1
MNKQVSEREWLAPPLTTRETRNLARFDAAPYRVLSLCIDTDSQAPEPVVIRSRAHSLLHQARQELEAHRSLLEHEVREAAHEDLERCRAFVDRFQPRGACRGLALFSCSGRDFWQHYPLPRPVPDQFAWGAHPLVLPALRLMEEYPRTAVILVDREQGRYFGGRLGEVEELASMREDTPRRVKEGGWYGLAERRIERHIEDHVRRHLKKVAAEAREVFCEWPVAALLVGGNQELFEEFRRCLHPSLRERWAGTLPVAANASIEQVHEVVLGAETELRQARESESLRQLYEESGAGHCGVVGVVETLRAVYFGEVDRLLVDADLHLAGYGCERCGALAQTNRHCPICESSSLSPRRDLVDEAIEAALAHGGQVEVVGEHAQFRAEGGIGALLRFQPR